MSKESQSVESTNNAVPGKTEPIVLQLCETEHLILRPNTLYLFTVHPTCARCRELERQSCEDAEDQDEDDEWEDDDEDEDDCGDGNEDDNSAFRPLGRPL